MRHRLVGGGLVAMFMAAAVSQASAANPFEDLVRSIFGGRPQPQTAPEREPLEMTVRPRAKRPVRPPTEATTSKPPAPVVRLDVSDPLWHLGDPTLRRGDIVVTRDGVVVFEGRNSSHHELADFIPLSLSKALPKARQVALEAAAAGGRSFFRNLGSVPPAQVPQGADLSAAR